MLKEITKLVIAILVVGGLVWSGIVKNADAVSVFLPLTTFLVGYYFKDMTGGLSAVFGRKSA